MFMAKLDSGYVRWWTPLQEEQAFRSLLLGCLRLGTGILGAQMIPEVLKMQKKGYEYKTPFWQVNVATL